MVKLDSTFKTDVDNIPIGFGKYQGKQLQRLHSMILNILFGYIMQSKMLLFHGHWQLIVSKGLRKSLGQMKVIVFQFTKKV